MMAKPNRFKGEVADFIFEKKDEKTLLNKLKTKISKVIKD